MKRVKQIPTISFAQNDCEIDEGGILSDLVAIVMSALDAQKSGEPSQKQEDSNKMNKLPSMPVRVGPPTKGS